MVDAVSIEVAQLRTEVGSLGKKQAGVSATLQNHIVHDDDRFGMLRDDLRTTSDDFKTMATKLSESTGKLHAKIDTFKHSVMTASLVITATMLLSAAGVIWALLQYQIIHPATGA